MTAAYLFIDVRAGLMRYAAAGHPPMLRLLRPTSEVRELEENGLALGFSQHAEYDELEETLEAGDRLLLYTDGLIEAGNRSDEVFGIERVKISIVAEAVLSPDKAADALLQSMDVWSGQPAADDLTIVLVDWTQANAPVVP